MRSYPLSVRVYKGWGLPAGSHYLTLLHHIFDFEVRGMTRHEYTEWQHQHPETVEFEGKVLRECVLRQPPSFREEPWDWDTCFAGVAHQVLEKIYNLSGYGVQPDPEITLPVEAYLNSQEARFDLVIMTAYNYKLEDLMHLDQIEYHRLLGLAQMKLEMMEIDTEAILYPERAKTRKSAVARPSGGGQSASSHSPHGTALGGAKPFFNNTQGRNPQSPYAPGHPKNPAVVGDREFGGERPMAFYSE